MSNSHKVLLNEFISELTNFSFSDSLVHLDQNNKGIEDISYLHSKFETEEERIHLKLPLHSKTSQIVKIALNYLKISDIQSLCISFSLLEWEYKNKWIQTPLFLIPVSTKLNKITNELELDIHLQQSFLNPYLKQVLATEYAIEINLTETIDLISKQKCFVLDLKNTGLEFNCLEFISLGNFHYHRFEILKDLEEIQSKGNNNELINAILGDNFTNENSQKLIAKNCFDLDLDQHEIFEELNKRNSLVVQGPPGTGKSQFLANLLCKILYTKTNNIVVSEKKTALQVLEQKLKTKNLHHFVFLANSSTTSSDFVRKLKKTWNFLEQYKGKDLANNLLLSDQYIQRLQLQFDKINTTKLFQYYTINFFQELEQSRIYPQIPFLKDVIDIDVWMNHKDDISSLLSSFKKFKILSFLKINSFENSAFFIQEVNTICEKHLELKGYFNFSNLTEVDDLLKLQVKLLILANEKNKNYANYFVLKKNQKLFFKLKSKFELLSKQIELVQNEKENWRELPNLSEIQTWKSILNSKSKFNKWKLKKRINKRLRKELDVEIAINEFEKYLSYERDLLQLNYEFSEIGINAPKHEIHLISFFISQINTISKEELEYLANIDLKLRNNLEKHATKLLHYSQLLTNFFQVSQVDNLEELIKMATDCKEFIFENFKLIKTIPFPIYKLFRSINSLEELENCVLKSNWISVKSNFPNLSNFTGVELEYQINNILREVIKEQDCFSEEIITIKSKQFSDFHKILLSSSTKLSAEEKERKKRLKQGKAILIKEFSKSKQHKTVRELLSSEAKEWIELLCPVFLNTPTFVSKHLPANFLFDFAIFDEASQLLLPRALTAISRSKRMLIAGDEQQMSPSQFFMGKSSSVDLLHQGAYHLPSKKLKHHYRSNFNELISFSNKHFYDNELISYPSSKNRDKVLNLHYVENATFENKQNQKEAKEVATYIQSKIDAKVSLGIVAFSEQQLNCIWNFLSQDVKLKIDKRRENNTLFFKTLEQVQGEECDELIISFGYGRNPTGEFHKRFGPLNFSTGAKRINVLLTRAKLKIDLFSSVRSEEFETSSNEAIQLFKLFLYDLEQNNFTKKELIYPFTIKSKQIENRLEIKQIYSDIKNVNELLTFHKVMLERGWELKYIL